MSRRPGLFPQEAGLAGGCLAWPGPWGQWGSGGQGTNHRLECHQKLWVTFLTQDLLVQVAHVRERLPTVGYVTFVLINKMEIISTSQCYWEDYIKSPTYRTERLGTATTYKAAMSVCWVASVVSDSATLWIVAGQAPLSKALAHKKYKIGLHPPHSKDKQELQLKA